MLRQFRLLLWKNYILQVGWHCTWGAASDTAKRGYIRACPATASYRKPPPWAQGIAGRKTGLFVHVVCFVLGCETLQVTVYSVSLSPASPACPLAVSSAPFLLAQGNPHPTRVTLGFFEPLLEVPVPPKPTGALGFLSSIAFSLSGAAFRGLKNIKPLALTASPPLSMAAGWC